MTCPVCNDERMVIVAGPDSNGMYDADDCPCQMKEVSREEEAHEEEVARPVPFGRAVESYKYLDAAIREHNPSHVFGLFSGGHDSLCATTVASAHPRFTAAVFIDTGTAIPDTVEFVHETCREQGWPLKVYKGTDSYRDLVLRWGFPGPAGHALMYRRLKERALRQLIREHKQERHGRIALVSGVRTEESVRRMRAQTEVHREGAAVWVPLIHHWTKAECNAYIEWAGLKRNIVSDTLHRSGECNCGAFAAPGEMAEIELWYPEFAAELHALEAEVAEAGHHACVWGQRPPSVHRDQMKFDVGPMCSSCEARAA